MIVGSDAEIQIEERESKRERHRDIETYLKERRPQRT